MVRQLFKTYTRMPWLLHGAFTHKPKTVEALLQQVYTQQKRLNFLQVGANDGCVNDNMHHLLTHTPFDYQAVCGICIEPQKIVFQDLLQTYANYPHVACFNLALSNTNQQRTLYNIRPEYQNIRKNSGFGTRLASFNRDHIIKHWVQLTAGEARNCSPEDYISSEQVDCMTFASFAEKAGINAFDILMIDTEGFDAEILKMVDLDHYRVKAVVLEHKHLSRTEKAYCYHHLKKLGFTVGGSSKDLWGLRQ